ncbi:hypothetical protein SDC9_103039 [bioreactor metagenome]|uniref:Uncharacterized protein n=1 Tax=bioreactor metagenome TaxID=1076179 RepID=A0A645AT32_9ZZZZ
MWQGRIAGSRTFPAPPTCRSRDCGMSPWPVLCGIRWTGTVRLPRRVPDWWPSSKTPSPQWWFGLQRRDRLWFDPCCRMPRYWATANCYHRNSGDWFGAPSHSSLHPSAEYGSCADTPGTAHPSLPAWTPRDCWC